MGGGWTAVAALVPAVAAGGYHFGWRALAVMGATAAGCAVAEALAPRLGGGPAAPAERAVLAGLLLGMTLPPSAPAWLVGLGCVFAAALPRAVRALTGLAPFHPALLAQAGLLILFPAAMTRWTAPGAIFAADAASAATPLRLGELSLLDGLVGRVPGGAGETSTLALLVGGLYLLWRRGIAWQVPAAFVGALAALAGASALLDPGRFLGPGAHLLGGGLALGALFLAPDPQRAPTRPGARLAFGAGCGVLTWLLRSFGDWPGEVCFAILLASAATPLLEERGRGEGESPAG